MGIGDWGVGIGDWGLGIGPPHEGRIRKRRCAGEGGHRRGRPGKACHRAG